MRALESSLLAKVPGIAHGFGTAHDPAPEKWRSEWEATRPEWKQVHGVGVARVAGPRQACGEVDALWTDAPESWIGVATADCVPILLADREGRAVATIHAGWRGTLARIVKPVLLQMERAGYSADSLVAAIGPSIRSCCFEVGEDLVENFVTEFPQIPQDLLNPRYRHLDLVTVNEALLRGMGVSEIEVLPYCTRCCRGESRGSTAGTSEFAFASYRRDGGGTRQWSIIARAPASGRD